LAVTATIVASTVSSSFEVQPVASADDLTLYFGSGRLTGGTQGGIDIWVASRKSTDDDFGPPVDVSEVNTSDDESPGWVSADGCRLYFHRWSGFVGRIFVASRVRPPALPSFDAGAETSP
jgi:hypothetical protein